MSSIANIVAVAIVGYLVLRRGRDQRIGNIKAAHWLRVAGPIPLVLRVVIYLVFGVGEIASEESGGAKIPTVDFRCSGLRYHPDALLLGRSAE